MNLNGAHEEGCTKHHGRMVVEQHSDQCCVSTEFVRRHVETEDFLGCRCVIFCPCPTVIGRRNSPKEFPPIGNDRWLFGDWVEHPRLVEKDHVVPTPKHCRAIHRQSAVLHDDRASIFRKRVERIPSSCRDGTVHIVPVPVHILTHNRQHRNNTEVKAM